MRCNARREEFENVAPLADAPSIRFEDWLICQTSRRKPRRP